jgi:hypothetical protein
VPAAHGPSCARTSPFWAQFAALASAALALGPASYAPSPSPSPSNRVFGPNSAQMSARLFWSACSASPSAGSASHAFATCHPNGRARTRPLRQWSASSLWSKHWLPRYSTTRKSVRGEPCASRDIANMRIRGLTDLRRPMPSRKASDTATTSQRRDIFHLPLVVQLQCSYTHIFATLRTHQQLRCLIFS